MKIKRQYYKPEVVEYFIDQIVSLSGWSGVTPEGMGGSSMEAPPSSSPQYENPSSAEYPFGGDSPDYTNM